MSNASSLQNHLSREKTLAQAARKMADSIAEALTPLAEERITIGELLNREKQEAEKAEIPWNEWCDRNLPLRQPQADKYVRVYKARDVVRKLSASGEIPFSLSEAVKLLPTQAEQKKMAYATGGDSGRDSDHWLTPSEYVEAARKVMGSIDFDPFSSPEGNEIVKANKYYTIEDDAFETPWVCIGKTVWMNPPYGRGMVSKSVNALLEHADQFTQAVVLVNNATDTSWFHDLVDHPKCSAFMFTRGRIAFIAPNEDKTLSSNTRGQAFVYFGDNVRAFCEVFREYGKVVRDCAEV